MSKVADYANKVARGDERFPGMPTGPQLCAMFARMLCERVGIFPYQMGNVYAVQRRNGHPVPYAVDMEQGLRENGYSVPVSDLKPGDLIFSNKVSLPAGHVAIYIGGGRILHNTVISGGNQVAGAVRVHPLSAFGPITTVARLDAKTEADKRDNPSALTADYAPPATTSAATPAAVSSTTSLTEAGEGSFGGKLIRWLTGGNDRQVNSDPPVWTFRTMRPNGPDTPGWHETADYGLFPGVIIVRAAREYELDFAMPFLGPLSIMTTENIDRVKNAFRRFQTKQADTARYGDYLEPIQRLVDSPADYHWPLPGVESIHLRMDASGDARGEVNLYIPDLAAAQAVHATLCLGQRYRNVMVEMWLPHVFRDPKNHGIGGERLVLDPVFVGMIEEVTASPWPSNISFRIVPQVEVQNRRGMSDEVDGMGQKRTITQHWENTNAAEILKTIGKDYGIAFIGLSPTSLDGLPHLKRHIPVYDALKRPPMVVAREVVEASGLRMKRVFGTELFGKSLGGENLRAVFVIYDPANWNPLSKEFWQNALFTSVWQPAFKQLTGVDAVASMLVFHPADMVEPERWKEWATLLEVWAAEDSKFNPSADGGKLRGIINTAIAALGVNPVGESYEDGKVSQTHKALMEVLDHMLPDSTPATIKTPVKVFNVEEMTSRNPTEAELANPLSGTTAAQGTVKRVRSTSTSAEEAATLMGLHQERGGQFVLPTPAGKRTFGGADQVFLYYSANESRPSMVTTGPQNDGLDDALGFYPYTITLRVEATFGLRIGMPACLLGFPRLDGMWEVASIEYEQGQGKPDTALVTLRTARDIFGF